MVGFPGLAAGLLTEAILLAWRYNRTGGNLMAIALWHGLSRSLSLPAPAPGRPCRPVRAYWADADGDARRGGDTRDPAGRAVYLRDTFGPRAVHLPVRC